MATAQLPQLLGSRHNPPFRQLSPKVLDMGFTVPRHTHVPYYNPREI